MARSDLSRSVEMKGFVGRAVSIEHLQELEEDIHARHRAGLFDEAFFQERLNGFVFAPPDCLPQARSLIVVAVPQPQVRFTFRWKGARRPVIVPPTYLHWEETDRQVEAGLAEILEADGYTVAQAQLPKKLLAVRSGLAEYGRNNITYVAGMGSFHRLVVLASDWPCEDEEWREPRMMERCESCRACPRNCPSRAITEDRFLLRAERCIVFHNEQAGDVPFPAWVDGSWHNCLVGCMLCQTVCPVNADVLGWIEDGERFSSDETGLLMAGMPIDQLPAETARKLEEHDLTDLYDVLPRNLGALFAS
ncbi:MAG: 4Fe-4S double cluster binding domain-containing protein [Anaerolineae bacterium]|jgi:epoxyqueuosine reductase